MSSSQPSDPGTSRLGDPGADPVATDAASPGPPEVPIAVTDSHLGGDPDAAGPPDPTLGSGATAGRWAPTRLTARWRRVRPAGAATGVPEPQGHGHHIEDRPSAWQAPPSHIAEGPGNAQLPPWFRRAILTVILFVIGAWVTVRMFVTLSGFWYTLFFAFFMGLCMEPAVNRLAARGMRRGMATFLVMFGLAAFTIAFFTIFGSLLATQMAELVKGIPELLKDILGWVNERFHTTFSVQDVMARIGLGVDVLAKAATNLGLGVLGVVGQAFGLVFKLFTIALFAFYFAADGPSFRRTVASWLTPANQRTFLTVWDISVQKAGGYVISRGLMAVASAFFHGIAFAILDVPYWLPMALWVGLVSQFIPTIGTYLAGALPIILCLVQGSWVKAVIVLLTVVLYQQVENYFVQPRITRSTLEIHAAVAFGSVIVGSTLFGATGALLAIPVVATLQSIISTYGRRYELVAELSDEGDEMSESDAVRVAEAMKLAQD